MEKIVIHLKSIRILLFLIAINVSVVAVFRGEGQGLEKRIDQGDRFRLNQEKRESPVKPELLLLKDSHPDYLQLGIYFQIEPGWYLYWLNPGEAGLPPQVKWALPEGFKELRLEFPVPLKFFSSGYLVYGYKEELLLVSFISKPKNFQMIANHPLILKAKLNWMVCRESCLTGEEELVIDLSSIDPNKKKKAEVIWNRFREKFPKQAEEINVFLKEAEIIKSEPSNPLSEIILSLNLDGQDLAKMIDFYPLPIEGFILEAAKSKYRDGLIELYLQPLSFEAEIKEITGLLIAQNSSYLVKFQLNEEEIKLKK